MKKPLLMLLLLVPAVVLAACSSTSATQEITLSAQAMKYQPAALEVVAGQPVRLTFRNDDTVEHDFSVVEFPVSSVSATQEEMAGHDMGPMVEAPALHVAAPMGETGTLAFTPSKPGTYAFYCTVAGHKEAGMVGTLIVRAP